MGNGDWRPGNPAELPGHHAEGEEWYAATQTDGPVQRPAKVAQQGQPATQPDLIDRAVRGLERGIVLVIPICILTTIVLAMYINYR